MFYDTITVFLFIIAKLFYFILHSIEDNTHTIPVNKSNGCSDYMSLLNVPDNTINECYISFL